MKLLFVLSAILALSLAEEEKNVQEIADSEAQAANIELMKEGADLKASASSYPYIPPSQREPGWPQPQKPVNNWVQPPNNVQNDYYWSTGNPVHHHPTTTTTPTPVIKQEHYIGDRGDYKYEYQLGDGTHVGEQGYFTDPKQTDESVVKRGFYSFVGGDGKTYTVTYWADHTGFHAYGDHLPTPPPPPTQVKPVYDQKPQYDYVPEPAPTPAPPTKAPQPTYPSYPSYPNYTPAKPEYVQPAPTYPPKVPAYNPPQQTYVPQQPTYNPAPPQYYPSQQYYPQVPQQQNNYVPSYNV